MSHTGAKPAVLHQRVGWLELFYDLVFVVVIERLTHLVHGDPSWSLIWTSIGLTFVVWLAWFNVSAMTNVSGEVGPRGRPLLFVSMAGMGVLAIGVEGVTEATSGCSSSGTPLRAPRRGRCGCADASSARPT